MKMDPNKPGGEVHAKPSMKGCEKFQARGKGDLVRGSTLTKATFASPGTANLAMGAHNRPTFSSKLASHRNPTARSKAAR